ncbi:MAG: hypothetical protein U1E76_15190 [Planctomycetota bacterium]
MSGSELALVDAVSGQALCGLSGKEPLDQRRGLLAAALDAYQPIRFTDDGTTLVVKGDSRTAVAVRLAAFDATSGDQLGAIAFHGRADSSLLSDRICAHESEKDSLQILEAHALRKLGVFPCRSWTHVGAWPLLLIKDSSPLGPLILCDLETGLQVGPLEGHWPLCPRVAADATEHSIVAALEEGHAGSVVVWDRATRKLIGESSIRALPTRWLARLSQTEVVLVFADGSTWVWNTRTGEAARRLQLGEQDWLQLLSSADGDRVLWRRGGTEGAELIDASAWRIIQHLPGRVEDGGGGRYLLSLQDRTATIFDRDGSRVSELVGHEGKITGAAFAPDGVHVATVALDRTVRNWETASGRCERILNLDPRYTDVVSGIAFFHDVAFSSTAPYLIVVGQGDWNYTLRPRR